MSRPRLRTAVLAAVAVLGSAGVVGSATTQEPVPGVWTFLSRPGADLWFHGLALVGFEGFAPMPLYDRDYADRIDAAKSAARVRPTPLDTLASVLRTGFQRDSAFEILHFVPLFFGLSELAPMLDGLESVAEGRRPTDFGTNALTSVLQRSSQRRLLGQFVAALRTEWGVFYRSHRADHASELASEIAAAQRVWDRDLAPALSSFLASRDLTGGVVFVSPAIGPEGRVFGGNPSDPNDNVAAVGLHAGLSGAPALALVRELCYPVVSALVERQRLGAGDRVFAERVSSRAAVRCGGMLLEQYAPSHLHDYRRLFLPRVGSQEVTQEEFERAFPVDVALLRALRSTLGLP